MGHMAEAIMTKSFINPRARKYFKEKEEVLTLLFMPWLFSHLIYTVLKISNVQSRSKTGFVAVIIEPNPRVSIGGCSNRG